MTNEERARRFLGPILTDGDSCLIDDDNEEDVALVASLAGEFHDAIRRALDEVGVAIAFVETEFSPMQPEQKTGAREALRAVAKVRDRLLADTVSST